jgi:hypothetical protein
MPNVLGLAPGEKTFILSFDHTTGRLVIDGTATVSADGQTIISDPGSGVTTPGWHGYTSAGDTAGGCGSTGSASGPTSNNPMTGGTGSSSGAGSSNSNPPLQIDTDFIHGQEGGIYTNPYIPTDKNDNVIGHSGITIGYGLDLGSGITKSQFETLFPNWQSDPGLSFLHGAIGLTGDAAQTYLNSVGPNGYTFDKYGNDINTSISVSTTNANALSDFGQQRTLNNLINEWNNNPNTTIDFNELPPEAQTALADVAYQYGDLPSKTPKP